mmetsp:Transcript_65147/g.104695  ORF Transcript_65147/g.104695 Transcript_65147/m.104695 type:complete len:88 (+) Transcript_65147:1969-2232(+)
MWVCAPLCTSDDSPKTGLSVDFADLSFRLSKSLSMHRSEHQISCSLGCTWVGVNRTHLTQLPKEVLTNREGFYGWMATHPLGQVSQI